MFALGDPMHALTDVAGEFRVRRLCGKADRESRRYRLLDTAAVSAFAHPLNHPAFDQTLKQAKTGCLAEVSALGQLPEREDLSVVERLQQATGADYGFDSFAFLGHFQSAL